MKCSIPLHVPIDKNCNLQLRQTFRLNVNTYSFSKSRLAPFAGFYDYNQMWSQPCFLPKACYFTYLQEIMFIKMTHCTGRHYAGLVYEESVSNCQTTNALSTILYEDKCLPKATPGPVDLHLCPVTIEIYICPFNRRHFQMVLSSLGVIVSIKCPGRG